MTPTPQTVTNNILSSVGGIIYIIAFVGFLGYLLLNCYFDVKVWHERRKEEKHVRRTRRYPKR